MLAITMKGLIHFPFCGWIEEGELFVRRDVLQCNELHQCGVEKNIRFTTVVDVLQEFRLQCDVLFFTDLNREIGRS